MIALHLIKESETRASVPIQRFNVENAEENEVLVDSVPEPEDIPFKRNTLYINPQTKEMWYEYVDRPLTQDEEIAKLKSDILTLQDAVNVALGL